MHKFACVLLYVYAGEAYFFAAFKLDVAVLTQGLIELRYLIGLWQVGIAIVLSVEVGGSVDFAVRGKACAYGKLHHLFVEYGQGARLAGAHPVSYTHLTLPTNSRV